MDHQSIITQKSTYFRFLIFNKHKDRDAKVTNTQSGRINKKETISRSILLQANTLQSFNSPNTHGRSLYNRP